MRKFIVLLLALLATPAAAQIQRVQGCKSGTTCDPVTVAFSGGGGGGDATAANQTTEIARLTSILTALGGGLPSALLSGALNVSSNVLATAALQTAGNASLASIDSKLTAPLTVTGPITDTQLRASPVAVSASSLPLPTGAANAVAQGSTTSGQTGELMQGAVTTNAPTYTNGQTSPINMGTSGGLRTQQIGDSFTWIYTAGSYGIRTGAGILRRIIVGSNVAGGINCYDNTAGSGTVIVSLTTTTSTPFNYVEVGAAFSTGLYCVTTGTGESFTVVYAPAT